jgi:MarR family transcriptional regulator, organic hydroperoxide resistance regulator
MTTEAGGGTAGEIGRLDAQLCFAIYAAANAYGRFYAPLLKPLGLTYPQYLVMLVLWEGDGVPVKTIGARLGLDSGTLTPLLKRLAAAGLVRRARDEKDERLVRVYLSEAGDALQKRVGPLQQAVARAFGGSQGEALALKEMLAELRRRLNRRVASAA